MRKGWISLLLCVLLLACDSTEQNKRKIVGEWAVDSIYTEPQTLHLIQLDSRFVFDSKNRCGMFLPGSTDKSLLVTYSISGDKLTIWSGDMGILYEIEKLTDRSLVLRESVQEPEMTLYLLKVED